MAGPVNTYLSFKPVKLVPNDLKPLAAGTSSAGVAFVAGVQEGDRPALYFKIIQEGSEPLLLRLDFTRLVDSVVGASAAQEDAWEPLRQDTAQPLMWGNSILSVARHQVNEEIVHLSYHRRDRAPIRDWRIGQRLKNELCGPEWEAIEIYPAESRLVDTSNEYHLWCFPIALPFGFAERDLATQAQIDEAYEGTNGFGDGAVQRDDPLADTSGFDPDLYKASAHYRTPRPPS